MSQPTFIVADPLRHRDALLRLNLEYMSWTSGEIEKSFDIRVADLVGMPLADYVASAIDKVCGEAPPRGVFYLLECDGALAGMGGLRQVRAGVCELKRVYVRPAFRGLGLGEAILQRTLADAAAFGYHKMMLDSGPFMHAAHRLYHAAGFVDSSPYAEAEVPAALHAGWRFMERTL